MCVASRVCMSQPLAVPDVEPPRDLDLRILDALRIQAWEPLLFVGCGDGWIAEEAWRRAVRSYVLGLDVSAEAIARAVALRGVPGRLEFRRWDGQRVHCADGSFHRVIAKFALLPSGVPAAVLAELHRVLQPRGHLYLLEVDRRRAADRATPPAFAAALHGAGFGDLRELERREVVVERGERATGAIVHARA